MPAFGKRNDGVTGRRSAARAPVLLPAALTTTWHTGLAELMNISPTGARLRKCDLPEVGSDVLLRIEGVEAFGTVVWADNGMCGVHFDEPLDPADLRPLQNLGGSCLQARMTPDERLAAQAWSFGSAR